MLSVEEKIFKAIMLFASVCAGRPITSMDEVDTIYNNKDCPALNDFVDYVIYGEC